LPLDPEIPVEVTHAEWLMHGNDLALGEAVFPKRWEYSVIPTQQRIPEQGEEVIALGYPDIALRNLALVMHIGRVEAILNGYKNMCFISVSFPSGPALSGGPVIDANGYCVGVMSENTFRSDATDAAPPLTSTSTSENASAESGLHKQSHTAMPSKPYGQAVLIGHWRDLPKAPKRLAR